jgi:hypothetical protein
MIRHYLHTRLKPGAFVLLSIFLSLLVLEPDSTVKKALWNCVFLLVSFLVFRLIDDAGSIRTDRIHHPDRNYLSIQNFPKFCSFAALISFCYLMPLFFLALNIAFIVLSLMISSIGLYFLFQNRFRLLQLIPLLKYPALLFCVIASPVSMNQWFVCGSSFFIMLSYELLEDKNATWTKRIFTFISLVIAGVFSIYFSSIPYASIFILIPFLMSIPFFRWKYIQYLPIAYYPMCVFINSLLT